MKWEKDLCYLSFKVIQVIEIEELKSSLIELKHQGCGARVFHMSCDDPENLFCLSFKTLPDNSKGTPHILEHVVLCGSRKYPVKDPFFAMTRRSLNTFMNALTGADFTCYPAASQVEKDFYNLLDVYLDAVFHPQIKQESFLQEGCRLELTDPNDPESPLLWKGIVFNEMKGALASPDSRLWHAITSALLPDLTYAHISGGDPKEIPLLTYQELLDFYKSYYHPSRCLFFFYGNLPLKKHLDVIEKSVLKNVEPLQPLPSLPLQRRFAAPKNLETFYPLATQEEKQTIIAWSWLTVPLSDQDTVLALSLLDAILMENDASLLKRALLQSGYCTTADAFLDAEMSEVPYIIVCKGCQAEQVELLEDVLLKTLQELSLKGIPPHLVESALHQLELSRTEIDSSSGPFGLSLFLRAGLVEEHGGRAEKALKIHTLFEELRRKLADPKFLPDLISQLLVENPHRVRVILKPDPSLLKQEQEGEYRRLKQLSNTLSVQEREKIAQTMHTLEKFQKDQQHQNIQCLPKVTLDDVPRLTRQFPLKQNGSIFTHSTFTNGFVYADLVMDLPALTQEELPWAQLLITMGGELGVGARSYAQNLELLQAHVGGMSSLITLYPQMDDPTQMKPALVLRSKALERNSASMLKLMKEWALGVRCDEKERIAELIHQIDTALQQNLAKNSLRYASALALSTLSPAGFLSETWQGLSYLQWIQNLAKGLPNNLLHVLDRLQSIKSKLLSFHQPTLILTCSEKIQEVVQNTDLLDLPSRPFTPWVTPTGSSEKKSQARVIPSNVAFTCQAIKVCGYLHPHAPALNVASQLMDHLVLHPKIREQGGAYGAGVTYSASLGHLTFHAFRDPHLHTSLEAFKESVRTIAAGNFTPDDLESAKLESIQAIDTPISPGARGALSYTLMREGRLPQYRQHYREKLLKLTPQEVSLAVQKELEGRLDTATIVTFAGQELLDRENKKLQKPLPVIPI